MPLSPNHQELPDLGFLTLQLLDGFNHISETTAEVEIKSENNEPYFNNDLISRTTLLKAITDIDNGLNMDIYTNEVRQIVEELPTIPQTALSEVDFIELKHRYGESVEKTVRRNQETHGTFLPGRKLSLGL